MKNPYPKIETLYKRNQETFKATNEIRCPEFGNIKKWLITEKIDGRNQRILYDALEDTLEFKGRTNKADMPPFLLEKLVQIFPIEKIKKQFKDVQQVCLYGESYGPRINSGGNYRPKGAGVSFRLIDIKIGHWWLEWDSIVDIAKSLDIRTVPKYGIMGIKQAIDYIGNFSLVAQQEKEVDVIAEGIVARSHPLVLFRNGNPVVWKLKVKDF